MDFGTTTATLDLNPGLYRKTYFFKITLHCSRHSYSPGCVTFVLFHSGQLYRLNKCDQVCFFIKTPHHHIEFGRYCCAQGDYKVL